MCDLFGGKQTNATKAHTSRRLVNELRQMDLRHGKDANIHLFRMFNIRAELASLNYNIEYMDMIEIMLDNLPYQSEFESLKSSIRYNADPTVYRPSTVQKLIRAAASRQSEIQRKHSGNTQKNGVELGKGLNKAKSFARRK